MSLKAATQDLGSKKLLKQNSWKDVMTDLMNWILPTKDKV